MRRSGSPTPRAAGCVSWSSAACHWWRGGLRRGLCPQAYRVDQAISGSDAYPLVIRDMSRTALGPVREKGALEPRVIVMDWQRFHVERPDPCSVEGVRCGCACDPGHDAVAGTAKVGHAGRAVVGENAAAAGRFESLHDGQAGMTRREYLHVRSFEPITHGPTADRVAQRFLREP